MSEWNEEGRLYLWGGALSAVVAWFVVPLFGLIAGFGAVGFLLWIAFLLAL